MRLQLIQFLSLLCVIDVKVLMGHTVTYSGPVRRYQNLEKVFLDFTLVLLKMRLMLIDADLAIFGCSDQALTLPQNQQLSLMFGMVLAKRVILMEWKSTLPPSFFKWLAEMVSSLKLERLHFSRAGRLKMFDKIWGPFLRSIF